MSRVLSQKPYNIRRRFNRIISDPVKLAKEEEKMANLTKEYLSNNKLTACTDHNCKGFNLMTGLRYCLHCGKYKYSKERE